MRAQTQDLQLRLTLLASCMSVNYSAEQKYIQNLITSHSTATALTNSALIHSQKYFDLNELWSP